MKKKIGIVRFLGTNCDRDVWQAVVNAGHEPEWLWYKDQFDIKNYKALIIPGGFSYGDYLRCGALAARSEVMKSVREAADKGYPVLGICNGFQILCEAHLLPGTLVQNNHLRFTDQWVELNLESAKSPFFKSTNEKIRLPVAHGEGRFYIDQDKVQKLFDDEQVWWTYENNPNGSLENIAGVMNETKNVAALMSHPERAIEEFMGGTDGRLFFMDI